MKTCTKCEVEKPLEMFYKRKGSSDGHRADCKACNSATCGEYRKTNSSSIKEAKREYYESNKTEILAKSKLYVQKNRIKSRASSLAWNKRNPHVLRENMRRWRAANPEKSRAADSNWSKANPHKIAAKAARRRASQLQATPAWAEDFLIEEAYDLAQRRTAVLGFEWHVDHIVPLRGKTVCGLHVHNNLQVIPGSENSSKSNRYWPDMPGNNHKDSNGPERPSTYDLDHSRQPANRDSGLQDRVARRSRQHNNGRNLYPSR